MTDYRDKPTAMNLLTRKHILRNIGDKTYARGESYFQRGHVLYTRLEDKGDDYTDIYGSVTGSGKNIYLQEITLNWEGGYCHIDGECSCPVSYNCKHVVAVCLQYEQDNKPAKVPDKDCLNWIDSFELESNLNKTISGKEYIVYLLKPIADKPGIFKVEVLVTRQLKSGGMGKGRKVNLSNVSQITFAPHYVQAIDTDIARLIASDSGFSGYGWEGQRLQGNLGYLGLIKMLNTGRCFWLETDTPLSLSQQSRQLSTIWQYDDNGVARLNLSIDSTGKLILTDPPMYLDIDKQIIGPLAKNSFTGGQLLQLLNLPAIPSELVTQFSQKLVEKIPDSQLPPPAVVTIEEINGFLPTPHLLLTTLGIDGRCFYSMQLQFDYKNYRLHHAGEEKYYQGKLNGNLVRIERNQSAEADAVQQIKTLGFTAKITPLENGLFFISYQANNIDENITRFNGFIKDVIPRLQQQGWHVDIDESFNLVFHEADHWHAEIEEESEHSDWFDLRFDIEINGRAIALFPLIIAVINNYNLETLPDTLSLPISDNEFVSINSAQIKPILQTLYELYDHENLLQNNSLRLSRFDVARLSELELLSTSNTQWRGGKTLRELGHKLKNFQGIKTVAVPSGLAANLRDYQQVGLNWLQFLKQHMFGGILADDMGLGKTVQTLAHILYEKEQGLAKKPSLIIAPTSLMSNWRRESNQFAPALKVLVLQGPNRHRLFSQIEENDIVLSTYPLVHRDQEKLLAHEYHILVLDEAQIVKNPKAKVSKAVRLIKAEQRLCLTGTPMENHLGELWSLFDFIMPGFLGDLKEFNSLFRTPIEKQGNNERRKQLVKRITPFMLRRTKLEVAKELPEKIEIVQTVLLQEKQAALYESIRISMEQKVRQAIADKGLARSHITILDALLKLRQVCCDPRLVPLSQAKKVNESAKLEWLIQVLPEMVEEGRRILLFSQFTTMLSLIERELEKNDISYTKLTGQTRNRDEAIDKFKSGNTSVFLISLKAGGVGLNLTEADTIIHYDPWWNPATENQATDRAHRIGQNKKVFVYKLITENSVEEKIIALQKNKQALAQGIYAGNLNKAGDQLSANDFQQLFTPL